MINLEQIDSKSLPVLENVLQLYLYEIGLEPEVDGHIDYGESVTKYVDKPDHIAYFITEDEKCVGIMMAKLDRTLTIEDGVTTEEINIITEFFVYRPYRKKGVGTTAALQLLSKHPGKWYTTTWPRDNSVAFWRTLSAKVESSKEYAPDEHKGFPGQFVWELNT